MKSLVDDRQFMELGQDHAGEVVTGFVRIEGLPAGVVANNSQTRGGVLFPETCQKMSSNTAYPYRSVMV